MKKIYLILSDLLDRDENDFSMNSTSDQFETWDSIAIISLAVALEDEFNISLSAEDVESLISVRAIVNALQKQGISLTF
jgi:acyl carrier protein